ncbi:MAG TPA: hypothetical protein PK948_12390 [Gemmatimonadales bacterium]|nr:hypothetical protein [Gemmatimonadales bacterium]
MRTASKLSLAVLALTLVGATVAQAQVSANINATALVQTPLTVTGAAALDFQNVFPGLAKAIAPTAATAGRFTVGGQLNAEVNITFTLPTNLVNGANNLPIGTWTGGRNTANNQAAQTAITPSGTTTTRLDAVTGALYIWLGATVTPTVTQVAGTYTAPVTMTVAYTGN